MIDIAALPIFTTVIEHGSFSRAAAHLGLSKSAVSKRVTSLEHQLGVKLLHRSTRSLSLTEAGELYYRHAVDAVKSAERAEALATSLQDVPSGILKVSAAWSFGRVYLAKIFPRFLKAYPEIELRVSLSDALVNPISQGLDVALHPGNLLDSNLIARKIVRLKSVLCASPDYLKRAGTPQSAADLLGHNCILSTHSSNSGEWTLIDSSNVTKVKVSGNYQVNNGEALREAIMQGVGIGRLPIYVVGEDIFAGTLKALLPSYDLPYKDLYAVYPHRQYLPLKVRLFIDFLINELSVDQLLWDRWEVTSWCE